MVILMLSVILFLLAITIATVSTRVRITGKLYGVRAVIRQQALGGVEEALHHLEKNTDWESAGGQHGFIPKAEAAVDIGGLTVYHRLTVLDYGIDKVTVRSEAYTKDVIGNPAVKRSATFTVIRDLGPFQHGVFGSQRIYMSSSSIVDSYNSSEGTYQQTKRQTGGDVGTNSTFLYSIVLYYYSWIYGDIYIHPKAAPSKVIYKGWGSGYSGSIKKMTASFPIPPVTPPTGTSLGNITVNAKTVELTPGIYSNLVIRNKGSLVLRDGTYVFNRITMYDGSEIRLKEVTSPAIVYLKDNIEAAREGSGGVIINGGSIVNTTEKPPLLFIMAGTNCRTIQMMGSRGTGPSCYFSIYAPNANIMMYGNSEIYGALVGKYVYIYGNSAVHFDRALRHCVLSPLNMRFISYQVE
ncbi:MAG: hypothetical protein M1269_05150 [Chloroflexi bacterium]|nr:hypothetical protein [Chloroflexota bacterium]